MNYFQNMSVVTLDPLGCWFCLKFNGNIIIIIIIIIKVNPHFRQANDRLTSGHVGCNFSIKFITTL